MKNAGKKKFIATLEIIGINPFVFVPDDILLHVFKQAGKSKGSIPVTGTLNGNVYRQTLVKYSGAWRLYVNTSMLKNSPKRIGEKIEITITFDPESRLIKTPEKFLQALQENKAALKVFESLSPSRKQEIIKYLANLKTEESLNRNIMRAINFLCGKESFTGRNNP